MYSLYIMYICTSVWMATPRRHDMACKHMHDRKMSRSVEKSLYGGWYHLSNFEVFSLHWSCNEVTALVICYTMFQDEYGVFSMGQELPIVRSGMSFHTSAHKSGIRF